MENSKLTYHWEYRTVNSVQRVLFALACFVNIQSEGFQIRRFVARRPFMNTARDLSSTKAQIASTPEGTGDMPDEDEFMEATVPSDELPLSLEQIERLTVQQLKQQLRLRGLKVSGRKPELAERLLRSSGSFIEREIEALSDGEQTIEANDRVIDVSEYLEDDEVGRSFKSIGSTSSNEDETEDENNEEEPEVWGSKARIVDELEGRRLVVDSLTESVIEFLGSNQTYEQAYVVATKDALKPFLEGGGFNKTQSTEEKLVEIQTKREKASRRPVRFEDTVGVDEGDENGIFANVLDRDYSDWGKYTPTGAQLSASEVPGVLLLSDVYGAFTEDTKALASKIAFECQPIVVMVPDLFRMNPWTGPTDGLNANKKTYEQWRSEHSDLRTSVNIRAAASCLRETYGVSSVVLWGTCYGGGRALEAASGWFPQGNVHDVDGRVGPPPVSPMAAVAWYPTRYNAGDLFGRARNRELYAFENMAVMAVFAEKDDIPGATVDDAQQLRQLLEDDERVHDHMVKVFAGQEHGFAHIGMAQSPEQDGSSRFDSEDYGRAPDFSFGDQGDAEVACLLSTAFMETYSRVFLPTVGPPVCKDDRASSWGEDFVYTNDLLSEAAKRDVRSELHTAESEFVEAPLEGIPMDPTDPDQEVKLAKLLAAMESEEAKNGPFRIEPDDDLPTIYTKLTNSDDFEIF